MLDQIQKRALESLLAEEDPQTRELVVAQLCANPAEDYQSVVEELVHSQNVLIRENAERVLWYWACKSPKLDHFRQAIHHNRLATWEDLERFNWDLCEFEYAQFDRGACCRRLDELAERVREQAGGTDCTERRVIALSQVLAKEEGFRGNVNDYYKPANSHLSAVLESRRGLPLTLSLLYVFVAIRLGWKSCGVGTPSHYLAALDQVVFDPFHDGEFLNEAELMARFRINKPGANCALLFKTTPYETAKRILANLLKAYALIEDEGRCKQINLILDELLAGNHRA